MIRQVILASCLLAVVFSACTTIGPAIGGSCPTGYSLVTVNGNQECADAANVAACSECKDANPNCAGWLKNGFCTNTFYTTAQRKASCAKSCNLC